MDIKQVFPSSYSSEKKTYFDYESDYYYDIIVTKKQSHEGWIFELTKKKFPQRFIKHEPCDLFPPYHENMEYYAAYESTNEIGWLAIGHQQWNNLARVWDIYVDSAYQRHGLGKKLMNLAESRGKAWKCRGIILECQSSNFNAIQFYLACGFDLIGFDLKAYTSHDVENHETRLEMYKELLN